MLASSVATATELLCIHFTISTSKLDVVCPATTGHTESLVFKSTCTAAQLLQHGLNKNCKPCHKHDSGKQSLNRCDTAVGQPTGPKSSTSKPLWSYYSKNKCTPFNQLVLYITHIHTHIYACSRYHSAALFHIAVACTLMVREDYTLEFPIAMAITNHPMKCAHLQRKNISEI